MAHKSLTFKIVGASPLLMHNGQLADPLNSFSRKMKEVSGKRMKTDADFEELARLEWHGSLYLSNGKPCIPGYVLEATLIDAARKRKRGKQAQAGIICPDNYDLIYDGGAPIEQLWVNPDYRLTVGARIQRNRIMRTRPKFNEWSAKIEVRYDPLMLNEGEIKQIVQLAGEEVGLMDWRPKFGRFSIE